jgi:hypothetical protein
MVKTLAPCGFWSNWQLAAIEGFFSIASRNPCPMRVLGKLAIYLRFFEEKCEKSAWNRFLLAYTE